MAKFLPSAARSSATWRRFDLLLPLCLVVVEPVHSGCATSSDGLTRTCTGDITGAESFDHSDVGSEESYTFVFKELTSSKMTASGGPILGFISSGKDDGDDYAGIQGGNQHLEFNLDGGAPAFNIHSSSAPTVEVKSSGGNGGSRSESKGSGKRTGGTGGNGGAGGALTLSFSKTSISASPGKPFVADSTGGSGGNGGEGYSTGLGDGFGGGGGAGGRTYEVVISLDDVSLSNSSSGSATVLSATSRGGTGGNGGLGKAADYTAKGGTGGVGGHGDSVKLTVTNGLTIKGTNAPGILLSSFGGAGGNGGTSTNTLTNAVTGGTAGRGGNGGGVLVSSTDSSVVSLTSAGKGALILRSQAGSGGQGGDGNSGGSATGGTGGQGGSAGTVTVSLPDNALTIGTTGSGAQGIDARSYGGAGGDGGSANGVFGKAKGGSAAGPGPGGNVSLTFNGSITTTGSEANAVLAHSVGGFAGNAGSSSGIAAYAGSTESAGAGGTLTIDWTGASGDRLETTGNNADGLFAQSLGGGGGKGSSGSGIVSLSGSGSAGGDGGTVTVTTGGGIGIQTEGARSRGIFAQSLGGGGGDGGSARGIVSIGGSGSNGGAGGAVSVTNGAAVTTNGADAAGIFAQSGGGGGGSGLSTGGIVAIGGGGGSGATGGNVAVSNTGNITTSGDFADAIFAQSFGGGGGHGSNALAIGAGFSLAIGGPGGTGGNAGAATVWDFTSGYQPTLTTTGDHARGLVAQSVGGGGGHGGNAISVSASPGPTDVAIALGGAGGAAGHGGSAEAGFDGAISTKGDHAVALMATSTGGGGGSAGTTLSVANAVQSVSVGVGGSGGRGGYGGEVLVCRGKEADPSSACSASEAIDALGITTEGDGAHGVLAASVGGGGGHSGVTIAGSALTSGPIDVAVGGDGGSGGSGGEVTIYSSGGIKTSGQAAMGILAKSVGQNGGAAYLTGALSTMGGESVNVSIGGKGADAGGAGAVSVTSSETIETSGSASDAISALSVGGGGGSGGIALSADGISGAVADVAVGGAGGGGGKAGDVTVDWSGKYFSTSGAQSIGINALSQGGSGGRGGTDFSGSLLSLGTVEVGVGAQGGNGGTAGDVSVTMSGNPKDGSGTQGSLSPAVSAISLGGNGGRGGASLSSTGVSQGSAAVVLGGSGGTGGTAGDVTATLSSGQFSTTGAQSPVVFAQSQGGNGGAGGLVAEGGLNVTVAEDYPAGNLAVNLGGSGGNGGQGGTVQVTRAGDNALLALDFQSPGILAQSLGGAGGTGGAVYSGQVNVKTDNTFDVSVDVGGSGGGGATGGDVSIDNTAGVLTALGLSPALFAQSVGGNGGNGGSSYNVLLNLQSQNESSASYQVTVGGSGGSSAVSGAVTVTNSGPLSTSGTSSAGIYAQSVGGNGGSGGSGGNALVNAAAGSPSGTNVVKAAVTIAVGGSGGTWGNGSTVNVSNAAGGTIVTKGEVSPGIFAQSVGGSGGDGGAASGYTLSVTGACSLSGAKTFVQSCRQSSGGKTNVTYAFNGNFGGSGGAGGDGGEVTVSNAAAITTSGSASHGIFAQSFGGGGGVGGSGSTGLGAFTSSTIASDVARITGDATKLDPYNALTSWTAFSLSIGGKGGASGGGNAVSVTNSAAVTTTGDSSAGIYAQSIGGGGGAGGAATSAPVHSLSIGGSGSGGGKGGDVVVKNNSGGQIQTSGDDAYGIFAQSVGGGGGDSGNKQSPVVNPQLSISLGGKEGVGGSGGVVNVNNADAITTVGAGGVGIFAQSIGGGGGTSPGGLPGASGTVTVGGTGNSSGNGGAVTVTHTGSIATATSNPEGWNVAAHGIFAQSVGGGGGYAGSLVFGSSSNFGSDLTGMSTGTDTSGNGGAVTVNLTNASIETHAGGSVGIFAQSVGGGGGVAGVADASTTSETALIGNSGGSGSGGEVEVVLSGSQVTTSGDGAHAIFAQSVGGPGGSTTTATKVAVSVDGAVTASWKGAHGIFAQSAGDGMGAIEIMIAEGATVTGGIAAVIPGGEDGAGIFIKDGTQGTITNYGTITSVPGVDGIAIHVIDNDRVDIDNHGTITGSIYKASSIDLVNRSGAAINAGALLDVDQLTNHGLIDPGGSGRVSATRITGHLTQGARGAIRVDLDPGSSAEQADQLRVGGRARLDGRVAVNLMEVWQPEPGYQVHPLVVADGGLTSDDLEVTRSAVAQYRLHRPSRGELHLGYEIHFANPDILAEVNDNQEEIARHIHDIYRAQSLDEAIARDLIGIEDAVSYARLMNTLSAEIAVDNQIASLYSSLRFDDALLGCGQNRHDHRFQDQTRCGWARFAGRGFTQHAVRDNLGFREDSVQLAAGGELDIGGGWWLGGALSYEQASLRKAQSDTSSDADRFQFGAFAKRRIGDTELSGSLAVSYSDYAIERHPTGRGRSDGIQRLWLYSGQLRAARRFQLGRWTLRPHIDLGLAHLSVGDFRESGPSGLLIQNDGQDDTFLSLQPAVHINTEIETDHGTLIRPRLSLGVTGFLGDAAASAKGRFDLAPGDVDSFSVRTELDRVTLDLALGLDVITRGDMTLRAEVFGQVSENTEGYGGGLSLRLPL